MSRMLAVALSAALLAVVSPEATAQSRDDVAVFDAALAHFASDFKSRQKVDAKFLVFNETTIILAQDLGFAARQFPDELLKKLVIDNASPTPIGRYVPKPPFRQSNEKMLGTALRPAGPGLVRPHYYDWEELRRRFPDAMGILELSVPVYSADRNSALVYFWTGCGGLCASANLYLLSYSDHAWHVTTAFMPWIS